MNNVEESKSLRTTPPILSLPQTGTAPNGRKLSNAFVHVRAIYGVGGERCSTPPKADLASGLAGSARSVGWMVGTAAADEFRGWHQSDLRR
jgi:hypothetical protein